MKIGILTITPNIGFGGIMQAYALKTALEALGNNVQIINYTTPDSVKGRITYFIKAIVKQLRGEFVKFSPQSEYNYRSQNVRPFIEQHLNFSRRVSNAKQLTELINNSYDAVIVGSDQVWRPMYVLGIENYFFKGVHDKIKKMAYAASFGVRDWKFTEEETNFCSKLLKSFSYVSVRENSGLKLVREELKYQDNVYCDLDPTLLAGVPAYKSFQKKDNDTPKNVFTYILDSTADKNLLIKGVLEKTGMALNEFNTNAENPNKPLKERVAPSVESWLNGIYNADFVVTDSFHGCVFSILFNKPFVVYVNKNRGAERFISILYLLGLEDRMIYNASYLNIELINKEIDWKEVNDILLRERNKIINRLKRVL